MTDMQTREVSRIMIGKATERLTDNITEMIFTLSTLDLYQEYGSIAEDMIALKDSLQKTSEEALMKLTYMKRHNLLMMPVGPKIKLEDVAEKYENETYQHTFYFYVNKKDGKHINDEKTSFYTERTQTYSFNKVVLYDTELKIEQKKLETELGKEYQVTCLTYEAYLKATLPKEEYKEVTE